MSALRRAVHSVVAQGARQLLQCSAYQHQTPLTADSMMAHTKLSLSTWPLAIYLLSQAKIRLSALALKRDLGVSYPTSWLLHQEINHGMAQREARLRLGGLVELDDGYQGGEHSGVVASVSIDEAGDPPRIDVNRLSDFTDNSPVHNARHAHALTVHRNDLVRRALAPCSSIQRIRQLITVTARSPI